MNTQRLLHGLALLVCAAGAPRALAQHPVSDINGHMGIGTTKPDPSAILDLTSTSAGLLLPRLTQAQIDALVNPAPGLVLFNTSTNELAYNFGSPGAPNWVSVVTNDPGSIGSVAWMLEGNPLSGGSPGTPNQFLGSINNYDVVFRSNNVERMRLAATGEVGIAAPAAGMALHVGGTGGTANVRMGSLSGNSVTTPFSRGATEGVVVADANGDLVKRPVDMIAPSGFDAITSGQNTQAAMQVGAGASIELSGGAVESNEFSYNSAGTSAVDLDSEVGGILPIKNGGTNSASPATAGAVAYGDGNAYQFTAAGLAGQVLTSNASGAPTWQTLPTTISFDSITGGVNTTARMQVGAGASIELSGGTVESNEFSYNGAGTAAVDLDSEVNGTLPIANGGTNSTAVPTSGGIAYGDGGAYQFTAAGTAGQVLVSNGAGIPTWGTAASGDSVWKRNGNSGTTAGTDFLGTTDDKPFEIHVDDANSTGTDGRGRVMRYVPNATSANIIGGYQGNSVAGGVFGATIAGGGASGNTHSINSNLSTISGGRGNSIGASSINSTIGGGTSNQVGSSAGNGTVGGGLGNVIVSGDHTTISGGFNNQILTGAFGASMGGGTNNRIGSHTSVVGGGNGNTIGTVSQFSTVDGGHSNSIGNSSFGSTISGGVSDTIAASSPNSTIGGGTWNLIRASSQNSTISGGNDNTVQGQGAAIGGGINNTVGGNHSAIPGGRDLSVGANTFGFNGDDSGNQTNLATGFNNSAYFGNVNLMVGNVDGSARELRFYEPNAGSYNYAGVHASSFKAGVQGATINYTLPTTQPQTGDLLRAASVAGSGPYAVELEWVSGQGVFDGGDNVRIDNNLVVTGDLDVEGELTVTGRIRGFDDFNELGNSSDTRQLTINGDGSGNADHLYVIGNARVTRNLKVDGDLTVGGLTTLSQSTIGGSNAGVTLTATVNTVTGGTATGNFAYTLPAGVDGRIIYINNASGFTMTGTISIPNGTRATLIHTDGGWVSF